MNDRNQSQLVERACSNLASDDSRDKGRKALAERLLVSRRTVERWIAGDARLVGRKFEEVRKIAGVI